MNSVVVSAVIADHLWSVIKIIKDVKNTANMAKKKNSVDIKPLADRVLIREETADEGERKTESGIIIPEAVGDDEKHGANRGEVVAVGGGKVNDDGSKTEIPVSVGDTVIFSWGEKLTIDEVDYHIVDQSNILAVIEG